MRTPKFTIEAPEWRPQGQLLLEIMQYAMRTWTEGGFGETTWEDGHVISLLSPEYVKQMTADLQVPEARGTLVATWYSWDESGFGGYHEIITRQSDGRLDHCELYSWAYPLEND